MQEIQHSLTLEEQLKTFFGYNEFRGPQREIVSAILEKKDLLAILPTGAGKSICYQLPALLMPGIAVIVSPLISLMQDQVVTLHKSGIPAVFLNSSLKYDEIQSVMRDLKSYKLLYVAPERLADEHLINALKEVGVSLVAIDEAHCISQWGHSFRPEYRQLSHLKEKFPGSPIVALTATATKDVQRDIMTQLAMKSPHVVAVSLDRPNLTLHIHSRSNALEQIRSFLNKHVNASGIIYAATRKSVEETFSSLQKEGFKVGKYHAGMTDLERGASQHDFLHGKVLIMVATVAFGMGIHKPDIRFIIHVDMPRSIEQYYQEVGRAGRDGLASECLMLYATQEFTLYNIFAEKLETQELKQITKDKTKKMFNLCNSSACRRRDLLRYFGETYTEGSCNSCDNCLDDTDRVDETVVAKKILSCVHRVENRFGIKYVIDVLRGAKIKSIFDNRHDRLSTYGLMKEYSEDDLRYYIAALISMGFLERTEGEYPVIRWSKIAPHVINNQTPVMIRRQKRQIAQKREKQELQYDGELFNRLSLLRRQWAEELKVPAFVVFGDRALMEMAAVQPTTKEGLLAVNGCGPIKWLKYGQSFLDVIVQYRTEKNSV